MRGRFADRLAGRAVLLDGQRTYCWWELLAWVTEASISKAKARGDVDTLRVIAPEEMRKARALKRDPGYADWWDMWAEQEKLLPAIPVDVEVRRV